MAHPNADEARAGGDPGAPGRAAASDASEGPDPVLGAGITLLGIFLMGTGGASDAHYVFDVGVATSVIGAITFVVRVALSAMKPDRAASGGAGEPTRPGAGAG